MEIQDISFLTQEIVDKHLARLNGYVKLSEIPVISRSPIGGTLDPYQGLWEATQAAHLLRRAMFGATRAEITWAKDHGLDATVDALLEGHPLPAPPVNFDYPQDPFTPLGETWIDKPEPQEFFQYRRRSLHGWTMGNMLEEGISIREKMTLFWHNHFVTAEIPVPKAIYQYITLLRQHAVGNFRALTKHITINPSMLFFLNGNQNTRFAPNENYARELLELFTVGKGPLAGPGDYTTFTEHDVREMSRVLTGWTLEFDFNSSDMPRPVFVPFLHDSGSKVLSHRFGNAQIDNLGADEYKHLIDVVFMQDEVSMHICRKLYRWFVYYIIDDNVEAHVIRPMAQILRDNDYEVKPVLRALLRSQHFYDINSMGCMIKHPLDFVVGNIRQFEMTMPAALLNKYAIWVAVFRMNELLQMTYYDPPSVAGWKPFHQEPSYNQLWISAVSLIIRQLYTDIISTVGFQALGRFVIDVLEVVAKIEEATNPNVLIRGIAELIYPVTLTQDQVNALKSVLIPGLPDFEWTVEYQAYLDDPENEIKKLTVELRLRSLLRTMLARPEYHLS